jgi:predicted RNA-binding protein YlxR (DUF448 family)
VLSVATNHRDAGAAGGRQQPERSCAGCRTRDTGEALLRVAHFPDGNPVLVPDVSHRLGGRGAWVHPRQACVKSALRGGFARALKCGVQMDAADLLMPARAQLVRRIEGLLAAARRRGWLAQGTDAVLAALGRGSPARGQASDDRSPARGQASTAACRVSLLLVAKDAAGRRNELVTRASEWRVEVVELFDKAELGRLSGKQELGFVAILEPRIAHEVADSARWLAGLSEDG